MPSLPPLPPRTRGPTQNNYPTIVVILNHPIESYWHVVVIMMTMMIMIMITLKCINDVISKLLWHCDSMSCSCPRRTSKSISSLHQSLTTRGSNSRLEKRTLLTASSLTKNSTKHPPETRLFSLIVVHFYWYNINNITYYVV